MIILGVDPGLISGAVAWIRIDKPSAAIADIPTIGEKAKARIDVHAFRLWIMGHPADHAFIERAGVMPKQGAASGFKYGRAVGAIEATLALMNIPYTVIEPSVWKRYFNLKGGDKESARQLAIQFWPHLAESLARKKDHGRAEALLIAQYGLTLARPALQAAE